MTVSQPLEDDENAEEVVVSGAALRGIHVASAPSVEDVIEATKTDQTVTPFRLAPVIPVMPNTDTPRHIRPKREVTPQFRLSIVVPVFNEEKSVAATVTKLLSLEMDAEFDVFVVDDGSTDATSKMLESLSHPRLHVETLERNQGKGAAVRTGVSKAQGTHLLIFDADSEYRVADIPSLIAPILEGRAEVVYGARRRGINTMHPDLVHALGNWVMTLGANLLYNAAMTDLHTCLKLVPVPLMRELDLKETGFGLDTEITAEILRRGFRPYEIPASYVGRTREEGKKIQLSDAFECFKILFMKRLRRQTRYAARDKSLAPHVVL